MLSPSNTRTFSVKDYDLAATLSSGQAFRWRKDGESWIGVIGRHWLRLRSDQFSITAETAEPLTDWSWLTDYLQLDLDITALILTFPDDEPMRAAVNACRGLRLLRQDPWECLASFILSSTKQIVQIQQIVELLCQRFGVAAAAPNGEGSWFAFPSAEKRAECSEAELRACKMGFRAPYLRAAAQMVAYREIDLAQ